MGSGVHVAPKSPETRMLRSSNAIACPSWSRPSFPATSVVVDGLPSSGSRSATSEAAAGSDVIDRIAWSA
jgi:hypothetical protein